MELHSLKVNQLYLIQGYHEWRLKNKKKKI